MTIITFSTPRLCTFPQKSFQYVQDTPKLKIPKLISIRACIPKTQNHKTHFNTCKTPPKSKYQNSFQYVIASPKLKMQELKTTSKLTPKKHPRTRNPNPHFEARFEFMTLMRKFKFPQNKNSKMATLRLILHEIYKLKYK